MSNEVSEYFMSLNIPIMEVSSYDPSIQVTICNRDDFRHMEWASLLDHIASILRRDSVLTVLGKLYLDV